MGNISIRSPTHERIGAKASKLSSDVSETSALLLISNSCGARAFQKPRTSSRLFGKRSLWQSFSVQSETRAFSRLRVHYETRLHARLLPNRHIGLECKDSSERYVMETILLLYGSISIYQFLQHRLPHIPNLIWSEIFSIFNCLAP